MTLLDDTTRPTTTAAPSPSPTLAAGVAALQAVAASLVLVLGPTVAAWVTGAGSDATWSQAVRIALAAWLTALGVDLRVGGATFGLAPLGLTILALTACWLSARRMARALDPNGERIAAGFGRARARGAPAVALVTFVAVWTAAVTAVAAIASTPAVRPVLWQAVLGGAVVGAAAVVAGSAAWEAGGLRRGLLLAGRQVAGLLRLPTAARRLARPAAVGLSVQLGGAALVLAGAVVESMPAILHVHAALAPGLAGGIVLVLLQLALLPNAVVWVAAFLAGPGFALGTATSVTPAAAVLGPLPALPMLAAVPGPGTLPGWAYGLLTLPFLAGGCLGVSAGRRADYGSGARASLRTAADAVGASLVAGIAMTALCWLSTGPAGPGRLAHVGPAALVTGAIFAAELTVGAFVGVLVQPLIARVRPAREQSPAGSPADPSRLQRLRHTTRRSVDAAAERAERLDPRRLRSRRVRGAPRR